MIMVEWISSQEHQRQSYCYLSTSDWCMAWVNDFPQCVDITPPDKPILSYCHVHRVTGAVKRRLLLHSVWIPQDGWTLWRCNILFVCWNKGWKGRRFLWCIVLWYNLLIRRRRDARYEGKVDGIYRSYIQHASPSPTSASDDEASGTVSSWQVFVCSNHQ